MKQLIIYILIGSFVFGCSLDETKLESAFEPEITPDARLNSRAEFQFQNNTVVISEQTESGYCLVQEIEETRNDIKFKAKRLDTEFYLKQKGLEGEQLKNALDELSGEQLFFIEFAESQQQDLMKKYFTNSMDESVSYLSFNIYNDFKVVNSKGDTIDAIASTYERNFHVAPFERILLSLAGVAEDEALELIYTDNLFRKGEIHFSFPSQNYLIKNTALAL